MSDFKANPRGPAGISDTQECKLVFSLPLAVMGDAKSRSGIIPVLNVSKRLLINAQTESHRLRALEAVDDNLLRRGQLFCILREAERPNQTSLLGFHSCPSDLSGHVTNHLVNIDAFSLSLLIAEVSVMAGLVVQFELAAVRASGDAFEFDDGVEEAFSRARLPRDEYLVGVRHARIAAAQRVDGPECWEVPVLTLARCEFCGCSEGCGKESCESDCREHFGGLV